MLIGWDFDGIGDIEEGKREGREVMKGRCLCSSGGIVNMATLNPRLHYPGHPTIEN